MSFLYQINMRNFAGVFYKLAWERLETITPQISFLLWLLPLFGGRRGLGAELWFKKKDGKMHVAFEDVQNAVLMFPTLQKRVQSQACLSYAERRQSHISKIIHIEFSN